MTMGGRSVGVSRGSEFVEKEPRFDGLEQIADAELVGGEDAFDERAPRSGAPREMRTWP